MQKINVYFKEIKLGELTQINNNYIYKAFSNNIITAHNKGYLTHIYKCDESFLSQELPYSLQNFIPNKNQTELMLIANILPTDSDFEKLYKIAKLNAEKPDFHIEA